MNPAKNRSFTISACSGEIWASIRSNACCSKGNALAELGRREEALPCYDQGLAIDPRDARAWHNKGLALGNLGRFPEAIRCFDKALAINPRFVIAWNSKGLSLNKLGRRQEAARCYDEARAIERHAR